MKRMMRICILAPAHSYHTQKWCKWFSEHGYEVHVISYTDAVIENASVHIVKSNISEFLSDGKKLEYLLHVKEVKKLLSDIDPDFISAHRAPSYGTVAALSGAKNYALCVWGDDIYVFPKKSILHKLLVKYSLYKAPHLFSTSNAMALEGKKYTKKPFEITPFGVDTRLFSPQKRTRNSNGKTGTDEFIVGTIKSLTPKYGIDYLIKAVAIVHHKDPNIRIKLRIAGRGSHEEQYKELARSLNIDDITTWLGFISQEQAAVEWANMDVGVVASTLDSESFGISAVEAQACGIPVIISDVPGLMETTSPGETSIVVRRKDEMALATELMRLYNNPLLRKKMGESGRRLVQERYEMNNCFEKIEHLFLTFISQQVE